MCAEDCNCAGACAPSIEAIQGPQGPPGGTPVLGIGTVTTLPAGSQATATITGSPLAPLVNFGLVTGDPGAAGAAGTPAVNLYTTLTAGFIVPALNGFVTINVANASWIKPGAWVYIRSGGYYRILSPTGPTSFQAYNVGSVFGWPDGVPLQPAPGSAVAPDGTDTQVMQAGVPGLPGDTGPSGTDGPPGTPGTSSLVPFVNAIPVAAPVPGQETQIYQNDPSTPTQMRFYYWNGTVWSGSGNFVGAPGTQVVTTTGDPNSPVLAGAVGTLAFRTDVPSLYMKTGVSTWTLQFSIAPTFQQVATTSSGNFGTVPTYTQRVIGYSTAAAVHTTPATTYTFDLAYQSVLVEADTDIEIAYNAGVYTQSADWMWQVENVSGSPINVTFSAGSFDKKTGLSLPTTLAAGAVQTFILRRTKAKILIIDTFINASV